MKHIIQYYCMCEMCKSVFNTRAEAEACEATHLRPYFVDENYNQGGAGYPKYPTSVSMQFGNGKVLRYEIDTVDLRKQEKE